MKRIFDFFLATFSLGILSFPMILIAILIRITSPGPALYWSKRVGKNNVIFKVTGLDRYRLLVITTELRTSFQCIDMSSFQIYTLLILIFFILSA